jgi:hypothetical protein
MGVAAPRSSSLEGDTHSPSGHPRRIVRARTLSPYFKIQIGLKEDNVVGPEWLVSSGVCLLLGVGQIW